MANAARDNNRVPTLIGVSSSDGVTPVNVYVDPSTHRLKVDMAAGSGTVTDVSVVSTNGFAGTVATSTTTPAITLSTTISGILKGNGTAISAATAGTDYTALAFKTIVVAGQTDVVADSASDTLTLVAGSNVTITTNAATDTITIASSGGASGATTALDNLAAVAINTTLLPGVNDGAALGDTTHNFSDLFLASGAVVNYANSNVVLTHTSGVLTLGTGTLKIATPTNTSTSVVTIDGTQTLTNKSITGAQITSAVATATALANARTIGGVSFDGTINITVATATGGFTVSGGTLALGVNSLTMSGSLAATAARVTKGWFTDIESTNMPTVGGTALLTSLTAPQFTTIELGAATDTTLARVSAGVISVEGVRVITSSGTTSGTILKNNGTTFVPSTETYAAPGTSGNVLTSDGTNWTSAAPAGGGGSNTTKAITQTTHGFAVNDVIKFTGSTYAKAKADTAANAEVVGIVIAVADANNFTFAMEGYITGLSALTSDTVYYLSDATAGLLTATEPTTTGSISKPVLKTTSTTTAVLNNMRGIAVGAPAGIGWALQSFTDVTVAANSVTVSGLDLGTAYVYKVIFIAFAGSSADTLWIRSNGSSASNDYAWAKTNVVQGTGTATGTANNADTKIVAATNTGSEFEGEFNISGSGSGAAATRIRGSVTSQENSGAGFNGFATFAGTMNIQSIPNLTSFTMLTAGGTATYKWKVWVYRLTTS